MVRATGSTGAYAGLLEVLSHDAVCIGLKHFNDIDKIRH